MKRRVCVWLLVVCMCLSSIACAVVFPDLSQYSTSDLQKIQNAIAEEILSRSAQDDSNVASGTLGAYSVSILDSSIMKDSDGNDCIVVTFEWSHTEKESQSFWLAFSNRAYQDGIEIEKAYVRDLPHKTDDTKIKAGAVLKTQVAFKLSNTKSPVEVEITEMFSFSNDKVEKTFVLSK